MLKVAAQKTLSGIPRGRNLYCALQRHVIRSMPPDDDAFLTAVMMAERHLRTIERYVKLPLQQIKAYEFGAGATLSTAMTFYAKGISSQTVTDVSPLARHWSLDHTSDQFRRCLPNRFSRLPELPLSKMNIEYLAPHPAIYPSNSTYDVVTTTSVLEHIPANDIGPILSGLRALLSPGGVMIHHIDYSDHCAHGQSDVSEYNYLRYSDRRWDWINSCFNYQNRLRHSDYLGLIEKAGFEIVSVDTTQADAEDQASLETMTIHPRFSGYSKDDLAITHGYIVAQPR